jgi:hypothetical protein
LAFKLPALAPGQTSIGTGGQNSIGADRQDITIDQFIQIVDSYIRWYNEKRIKISLGSLSPIEYRASLGITA